MTISRRRHRASRAVPLGVLAVAVAGCAGSPVVREPPGGVTSEWIDGHTATSSEGFDPDATGDLVLRDSRIETTTTGYRITIVAEGDDSLGWSLLHSGQVTDAPPYLDMSLSGFTTTHPDRRLRADTVGSFLAVRVEDAHAGGAVRIAPPMRYRYEQPTPQTLVVEVETTSAQQAAFRPDVDAAVPIDPTPAPWDGVEFTAPDQTLTSPGYADADDPSGFTQPVRLTVTDVDDYEVRLEFDTLDGVEWEARYVETATDPATGEELDLWGRAVLRVDIAGIGTAPSPAALGFGTQNDDIETWVSEGENGGAILWIGVGTQSPFTVVPDNDDENTLAVAIEM